MATKRKTGTTKKESPNVGLRLALEEAVSTEEPKTIADQVIDSQASKMPEKVEPEKTGEKLLVLHEIPIDKFNTLRERRVLTPCTCDECGFDVALDNDVAPYDQHEPEEQQILREALKKHKLQFHDVAQKKIIKESQVPGAWLGPKAHGATGRRKR